MKKISEIFGGVFPKNEELSTITGPLILITDRTVAEICGEFELQEEAKPHLSGEPEPHEFVNKLIRARLFNDATRFLAYGLPKRQAVWWAYLCVKAVPVCCADEIAAEAMHAAEVWIENPSEENCEAALVAGSKHDFKIPTAPAAWTAMAAGWSSGEIVATNDEVPAPTGYLTAHAVSGAIILAVITEPNQAKEVYRKFLKTGVQIAQGKKQISI